MIIFIFVICCITGYVLSVPVRRALIAYGWI